MIITAVSNDKIYLQQLFVLLESLETNAGLGMKVYLIDYPKQIIKGLEDMFPLAEFIDAESKFGQLPRGRENLIKLKHTLLGMYLEEQDENVVWLDIDTIIRGDISEFLEIEEHQFKILVRDSKKEHAIFNTGVMNIGNSISNYSMIENAATMYEKDAYWMGGQYYLWKSYSLYGENVELVPLSDKYNDLGGRDNSFEDDSLIWHCKASHFDEEKYQKEFQYYLGKAIKHEQAI